MISDHRLASKQSALVPEAAQRGSGVVHKLLRRGMSNDRDDRFFERRYQMVRIG